MSTSKWMGLWAQKRQGFYAGQVIKKGDIPKYTRIVLRYNKFYEKGGNRPRFVYCFADSEGYEDRCVPIELDEDEEYEDDLQEKVEKLTEIMRQGHDGSEYRMLPSESQARAQRLEHEAISLVEEITGEKWEFAYTYF